MQVLPKSTPGGGKAEVTVEQPAATTVGTGSTTRAFLKNALLFILAGLVLYLIAYGISEQWVYQYALRNRFFQVKTAPHRDYDFLFLGASHMGVFDYQDMNAVLEERTNSKIINLSLEGAGPVPNRLMYDYFLQGHTSKNLVYSVDSFTFNSPAWNEERLQDVRLYQRAPFDPALVPLLWQAAGPGVALNYASGFAKINNADRFQPDMTEEEATRFERTYRPIRQIDDQRFQYLYPGPVDPAIRQNYLDKWEALIADARARGMKVIVIKTPIPKTWYDRLPNEQQFDQDIQAILQRHGGEFHDFSLVSNETSFFYNTDHLNKTGVLDFYDKHFVPLLQQVRSSTAQSLN